MYVKNRDELLASGKRALRTVALDITEAAIACANPAAAVRRQVKLENGNLWVNDREYDLSRGSRIFVVGAGKATFPIAKTIEEIVGDRIHAGLVTCKRGQLGSLNHIELLLADHPVPTAASLEAARRTALLLQQVRPSDVVIACFTGGSSALFVSPTKGISLKDKAHLNEILLTCGANIIEINAVRKRISTVKGGRLVRSLPAGTRVINLTVSDVIGNRLDYITDPSVPDTSTLNDAKTTLDKYNLWDKIPASVVLHLRNPSSEDAPITERELSHIDRHDVLLVDVEAACWGAARAAERFGFKPLILSTLFEGESSALGRNFAAIARQVIQNGHPATAPCAIIGSGETTVTTNGGLGRGGPNQEFAVAAALDIAGLDGVVALGLDTDGTDGPTQYAGALVDGSTAQIALDAGIDLHACLSKHDVTPALERIRLNILTGNTGTNVNDLKLVLVASQQAGSE